MRNYNILLLAMLATISFVGAAEADSTKDISKAWSLDLKKISIDPSKWDDGIKSKMLMVGAGMAYATTLSMPLTYTALFGIGLLGLVNLSWVLVAACSLALYGWRTGKKTFLLAGLGATYALAFGVSLV